MNADKPQNSEPEPASKEFTAVFEKVPPSEGGGFVAYAREIPGAISEGDTLEEARENLGDAVAILVAQVRESEMIRVYP
jgi:predicted RNase H-like HicB family nuclease